jgi:hypothetical protein
LLDDRLLFNDEEQNILMTIDNFIEKVEVKSDTISNYCNKKRILINDNINIIKQTKSYTNIEKIIYYSMDKLKYILFKVYVNMLFLSKLLLKINIVNKFYIKYETKISYMKQIYIKYNDDVINKHNILDDDVEMKKIFQLGSVSHGSNQMNNIMNQLFNLNPIINSNNNSNNVFDTLEDIIHSFDKNSNTSQEINKLEQDINDMDNLLKKLSNTTNDVVENNNIQSYDKYIDLIDIKFNELLKKPSLKKLNEDKLDEDKLDEDKLDEDKLDEDKLDEDLFDKYMSKCLPNGLLNDDLSKDQIDDIVSKEQIKEQIDDNDKSVKLTHALTDFTDIYNHITNIPEQKNKKISLKKRHKKH